MYSVTMVFCMLTCCFNVKRTLLLMCSADRVLRMLQSTNGLLFGVMHEPCMTKF